MRAEHLKRWIATARKSEKDKETAEKEELKTTERAGRTENGTETDNWTRVVDLVQSAFR